MLFNWIDRSHESHTLWNGDDDEQKAHHIFKFQASWVLTRRFFFFFFSSFHTFILCLYCLCDISSKFMVYSDMCIYLWHGSIHPSYALATHRSGILLFGEVNWKQIGVIFLKNMRRATESKKKHWFEINEADSNNKTNQFDISLQ